MRTAGIDPGLSAAIAFFDTTAPNRVDVFDMPVVAGVVDGRNLARLFGDFKPHRIMIEDVHAMPKQGVVSTFKFGRAFGTAIGVAEGLMLPMAYVSPSKWKRAYALDSDAEKSRRAALNLFPESSASFARKKDHNRAEASLLAHYAVANMEESL